MTPVEDEITDFVLAGRGWSFGDNVPTDQIVPTEFVLKPMDEIRRHILEELKPGFASQVKPGDIIVAGHHFGQSSGRAVAPKALQAAGVAAIVAVSFARTFLRNCFEIGLPIVECPDLHDFLDDGDRIVVDVVRGNVRNETKDRVVQGRPTDPFLLSMLRAGGLIALAKQTGAELGLAR